MNFNEFEAAWNQQATPPPVSAKATFSMRGRLLGYQVGVLAFTLLVYPLLSVGNFKYLHPVSPVLFWLNVVFQEAICLGLLAYTLRRVIRHRRLRRQSTETLRDYNRALLNATEAEMWDTRWSTWLAPLFLCLALYSAYQNNSATYGWRLFGTQVSIIAVIVVPIMTAMWWRHVKTLKPDQARLQSLLREME